MQITTIIYTAFCIFTIIFPEKYISELFVSFLPYHIAILLFLFFISLYQAKKSISSNQNNTKKRLIMIVTLIVGITFFSYTREFKNFYEPQNIKTKIENQSGLKILYANIHKDNQDYENIKKAIENEKPDLIMFVEFSENHYNHLKDFLKKNYPYINSTTRSQKFIGSMVFSKTTINNRADNFPQGKRRYGYFQIKYKDKDYYIYLVHTSSPDDYTHFAMRNTQLETLGNDIKEHEIHRNTNNVIIIGDFNISPRSYFYKNFERTYLSGFYNQTKKLPFLFTWTFKQLPIFKSHIDQIRTTNSVKIINLKSIVMPGSDHKGFTLEISS